MASDADAASSHDEESSEEDAWARDRRGESVGRRSTAGAPCSAQKPAARASINRAVAYLTLAGAAGNRKSQTQNSALRKKRGPKRGPTPAMASSLVDSMASLCDSSLPSGSAASASFPVRTSTFTATILGVHTQFVLSAYANRIFIVVSQTANFGTLVRAAQCAALGARRHLSHP